MADNDLQLACGLAHQLNGALGNKAVRGAVEAVAAQMVFLIILGGNGIAVSLRGHGHMEGGVEHGDLRRAGHDLLAGFNAHEVGGIVQGAEGDAVADGLLAGFVDDAGGDELVAAVQDAVADGVDLLDGLDHAVLRIDQDGQDGFDCLGMGGHRNIAHDLDVLGRNLMGQTAVDVDPLTQTLGEDLAGFRVHELILQGRAACIDNENVHDDFNSCKNLFLFFAFCGSISTYVPIL